VVNLPRVCIQARQATSQGLNPIVAYLGDQERAAIHAGMTQFNLIHRTSSLEPEGARLLHPAHLYQYHDIPPEAIAAGWNQEGNSLEPALLPRETTTIYLCEVSHLELFINKALTFNGLFFTDEALKYRLPCSFLLVLCAKFQNQVVR